VFSHFFIIFTLNKRAYTDWVIDLVGLFIQGIGVAVIQTFLILKVFPMLLPNYEKSLSINPLIQFLISFVFIDYIYYWNHRMLHSDFFWRFHFLHHSAERVDWLTTSRNYLFAPLVICYLWIHAFFIFILTDYSFYLAGVMLTYSLDIWRHSHFSSNHIQLFQKLEGIVITPQLHHKHHSKTHCNSLFGANFSWWDSFHGTKQMTAHLDVTVEENLVNLEHLIVFPTYKKVA